MYLKKGDKIGIVAPSRFIDEEGLEPGLIHLRNAGFEVVKAPHIFNRWNQFAGTEEEKISDFQAFLNQGEIKAILAARGGYGVVRILDRLDFRPLDDHFKWLCGYSDFTAIHSHLNRLGVPSIHSTMPINMRNEERAEALSLKTLIKALSGEDLRYELPKHPLNKVGNAHGDLCGGNLSMLYSLMGSVSQIETHGKILFLEDLDEYLYHIDRMMMGLKRAGMLGGLSGLILGSMSDMNDNTIPYGKTAEEIIYEHCAEFDYPVYFGFQAGHLQPNLALRLGKEAVIKDNQLFLPA